MPDAAAVADVIPQQDAAVVWQPIIELAARGDKQSTPSELAVRRDGAVPCRNAVYLPPRRQLSLISDSRVGLAGTL